MRPSSTRTESHPPRGGWHLADSTPRWRSAAISPRMQAPWGPGEAEDVGAGRSGRPGCRDRHRRRGRLSSAKQATPAAQEPPANTAKVEKGKLSAMVSMDGTLTYRARSDGSPYSVINQARGTYTELPDDGDKVDCGDVLYRVDDNPVLLLCGTVPAYRDLRTRRCGRGRPSAQPEPAQARLRRRGRCRYRSRRQRFHLEDGAGRSRCSSTTRAST